MVDTGNVEQDVVQMDRSDIILLEKQGDYWEEIDYSLFDVDNIDEGRRYKYSVDMLPYATVIGYRNDVFPEGPQGQADFWNQETFPGPRTTAAGSGGVTPYLEFGLIADGVSKDEVYPIDIDRAYEMFSQLKPNVPKFWEAGAQPAQMLTDNEAVMAHSWNGRMHAIMQEGAPVTVQWNEAQLATDVWAIPKGAANAENAQKFAAFITLPVSQARLSYLIPYGSVNNASADADDSRAARESADRARLPGEDVHPRHPVVGRQPRRGARALERVDPRVASLISGAGGLLGRPRPRGGLPA